MLHIQRSSPEIGGFSFNVFCRPGWARACNFFLHGCKSWPALNRLWVMIQLHQWCQFLRLTFSFLCNNHSQPRNSILFPKEHHLQFGKLDFGAEKTKITKRTNHWYFVHMTSARAVETILQGTKRNFLFLKDGRQAKAIKL